MYCVVVQKVIISCSVYEIKRIIGYNTYLHACSFNYACNYHHTDVGWYNL